MTAATTDIAAAASAKRAAAEVKGGRSRKPPRITSHVLPQTAQSSATSAVVTERLGAGMSTLVRSRLVPDVELDRVVSGRPTQSDHVAGVHGGGNQVRARGQDPLHAR